MSQDVYIFEVTETNFPTVVVENSHKIPVVALFQRVSSELCFVVDNLFSALASEFAGRFIFVKVDIDEQQGLRKQYHIENIPTVLLFQNGEVVRVELGQLDEAAARGLLRGVGIFYPSDVMREEARAKHLSGDTAGAIMLLTQAIQQHPSNTRVAMDMVQIFLDIGELQQARGLFNRLPERDRESDTGKSLQGQLTVAEYAANTDGLEVLLQRVAADANDSQARFDLVLCLVAQHDYQQGMEHLLHIIRQDPDFREGSARELMVLLIRTLTPSNPELAAEYQRKLANLLAM